MPHIPHLVIMMENKRQARVAAIEARCLEGSYDHSTLIASRRIDQLQEAINGAVSLIAQSRGDEAVALLNRELIEWRS